MPNKPQKGRPCSGMVFLFVICRKVKRQSKLHSKRDKPLKDCRKRGFTPNYHQLPPIATIYHHLPPPQPPHARSHPNPPKSTPKPTQSCVVACSLLFFPGALRAIISSPVRLVSVAAVRGCSRGGSRDAGVAALRRLPPSAARADPRVGCGGCSSCPLCSSSVCSFFRVAPDPRKKVATRGENLDCKVTGSLAVLSQTP